MAHNILASKMPHSHHVSIRGHRGRRVLWHMAGREPRRRHEPLVRKVLQVTLHNIGRGPVLFHHGLI
jgi:hypothetical protein